MEPTKEPENVATTLAPSSGQPVVPPAAPPKRFALVAGLGVIVVLVAIIAIVTAVLPADEQVAQQPTPTPTVPPGPNPTIVKKGEATTDASLREEALQFLDQVYAQQNGGKPGTREEALQFLEKAYAQQLAQQQAQAADEPDPDAVFAVNIKAALAAGQLEGANSATVTVVEAWDFAWPHCQRVSSILEELVKDYGGKLRVVYMNEIVHPQTVTMAHQYGCAAAKQNKFVAYKRAFWEKGFGAYAKSSGKDVTALGADNILKFAPAIGLDAGKLKADAESDACKQRVADDMAELAKFHVNGTPGFFINGKFIGGGMPKAAFQKIIDEQLKIAEQSGIPGAAYYDTVVAKGEKQFKSKAGAPSPKPPTRDDAIAFLVDVYKQQKAQLDAQAQQEPDPNAVFAVDIKAALAAGQVEGSNSAIVTIVEAWDFGWPHCFRASSVLEELVKDYGGKVRVVYMNMVVHPQIVQPAHLYGCAAARQGKFLAFKRAFWDKAYGAYEASGGSDTSALGEDNIKKLAGGLGLDAGKLAADANSDACTQRVADDMTELAKFHVNGTPAFFINGKYIGGGIPKAELQTIIDDKIKVAEKSGVPGATYYDTEIMGQGVHEFRSKASARKP